MREIDTQAVIAAREAARVMRDLRRAGEPHRSVVVREANNFIRALGVQIADDQDSCPDEALNRRVRSATAGIREVRGMVQEVIDRQSTFSNPDTLISFAHMHAVILREQLTHYYKTTVDSSVNGAH